MVLVNGVALKNAVTRAPGRQWTSFTPTVTDPQIPFRPGLSAPRDSDRPRATWVSCGRAAEVTTITIVTHTSGSFPGLRAHPALQFQDTHSRMFSGRNSCCPLMLRALPPPQTTVHWPKAPQCATPLSSVLVPLGHQSAQLSSHRLP